MNPNNYTDNNSLLAFRNGEEKGFNFFFKEYYSALCYFSFKLLRDRQIAEEIAGDAFIKLWERHSSFQSLAGVRSFLYTTVRNASIDFLRCKKGKLILRNELIFENSKGEKFALEKMIEAEAYRAVIASLNILPAKCRRIFAMFYFEGKDYKQIAEELKLSINTIRVQKARALALLRKTITLFILFVSFVYY